MYYKLNRQSKVYLITYLHVKPMSALLTSRKVDYLLVQLVLSTGGYTGYAMFYHILAIMHVKDHSSAITVRICVIEAGLCLPLNGQHVLMIC